MVYVSLLVALGALGLVLQAIFGPQEIWDLDEGSGRLTRLAARRARLLRAMKDLEFERDTGALSEAEFVALRRDYKRQTIAASRELDRVRKGRVRRLARGGDRVPRRLIERVEKLALQRGAARLPNVTIIIAGLALLALSGPLCGPVAAAGLVVHARLFDAEASDAPVREAVQKALSGGNIEDAFRDDLKVPFANREVVLDLVRTAAGGPDEPEGPLLSWTVRTDAEGSFSVDTSLEKLAEGTAFVLSSKAPEGAVYSRFFRGGDADSSLMMYPSSASTRGLRPRVSVTYDYRQGAKSEGGGSKPTVLVVQIIAEFANAASTLFVGRERFGQRELLRMPLPAGARIVENAGPDDGSPVWIPSEDGRSLVIDGPVPGFFDAFGGGSASRWSLRYEIPARQRFVQSFSVPFAFPAQAFTVWCVHQDMELEVSSLDGTSTGQNPDAPVHKSRSFEVRYSARELAADKNINVVLTVDNAPIQQVRTRSVLWVAGFLLAIIVASGAGLLFGRKEPSPEELYGELSGDEVLDRIVDLDRRSRAGRIGSREYERHRDVLVRLAAEELDAEEAPAAVGAGTAAVLLPDAVRSILRRIDEIDASGRTDPDTIRERTQLLDAMVRAMPREAGER